jgi:hypothetical protein
MLGHGLQFFAVNCEVDDDCIGMVDGVRDFVPAQRVGRFIPGQGLRCFVPGENIITDFDQADGLITKLKNGTILIRLSRFGLKRSPMAKSMKM